MEKRPEELTQFRPKIGSRRGEVPYQRAPRFIRSVVARARLRFLRVARVGRSSADRRSSSRRVADVAQPLASTRRCVIKARVVRLTARGLAAACLHLSYIERDGAELDGSPGRLYGAEDAIDRATLADTLPGERHQFRFIVSPEDDVDLRSFTRTLMAQVERDLNVRLHWGAVNHHDTDNPHAHVVVRGVDRSGREVRIDRAYMSNWMRWQAQHLLTAELGPRPSHEVERQLEREVGQERMTTLDYRLARALGSDQTIDLARLRSVSKPSFHRLMVGRLQTLEAMQLAARTGRGTWRLAANWQEALRHLGDRGDAIKRIHQGLGGAGDPSSYRVLDGADNRPPIEGVVRRKGLHDELRGDGYAIVESPRGEAAYVRLDGAAAANLIEGEIVRAECARQSWSKPMDRVLAQVARESGGVYDPAAHLAWLRRRPLEIGGKSLRPEDVVAANVRRLTRLTRYSLVSPLPDGRWRVPPNLVETLTSRDATHPRRLVQVRAVAPALATQVGLRRPCWLDDQDPAAPRAPYGFGSSLNAALMERAQFLRGLGLPTEPKDRRWQALEQLERRDAARRAVVPPGPKRGGRS